MKSRSAVILLVVMVVLAGCNTGPFLFGTATETATSDVETETTTASSTEAPSTRTATATATPTSQSYELNRTESGEILIQLSELNESYTFSGEQYRTRNKVNKSIRQQYIAQGILAKHQRSFVLDSEAEAASKPRIILSVMITYTNTSAASSAKEDFIDSFDVLQRSNQTVTGVTTTKIRFRAKNGLRNTVVIGRVGNILFYVLTSGAEYYGEMAIRLFVKMRTDL